MSQDYHREFFSFSNGFERSSSIANQPHHQHIASQILRDKGRIQGFELEPPQSLVGLGDEESGGIPGYEPSGMLSEMFNFTPAGAVAAELLDPHAVANYRSVWPQPPAAGVVQEWYGGQRHGFASEFGPLGESKYQLTNFNNRESIAQQHHHHQISTINADSAASMQIFLTNPQRRSPSPPPSHHHHNTDTSTPSTFHMLLPNRSPTSLQGLTGTDQSSAGGEAFGQFTWVPDSGHDGNNPGGGIVEGQGLSLSLSSSLQHLEAAKAEQFRIGGNGFSYCNQGPAGTSSAALYYKNLGGHNQHPLQLQGLIAPTQQVHVGFGSSSLGAVNVLRSSKYVKAAQELLEEFCSVGRSRIEKNKFGRQNSNPNSNLGSSTNVSSSSKDVSPLSAADRNEHQRKKVKLLAMLDEVDRRYNHYCEQMQMVVNSFDMVMGFGAAVPYTALAQKAMSRHFRCLKDAVTAQLKRTCEVLGEKDGAGNSGLTKGETPRLKLLEQSLRQQRAFQQMGIMEQEAWRPQRGLPERSVNILRAWLFEHFLHPYPSDADKHVLARQTGLSRNQVSNWFINARVRLWKPMVEEMYQQEAKDDEDGTDDEDTEKNQTHITQNPTSFRTATTTPHCNAKESDPSLIAINTQCFSENQEKNSNPVTNAITNGSATEPHDSDLQMSRSMDADEKCGVGDVSLTLGLRHAGNMPDKSASFSLREFGAI